MLFFRTGKIGIYEGDDVDVLARNFCRAFSLNKTMFISLQHHLKDCLSRHYA